MISGPPPAGNDGVSARDWIKAALLIAVIVGVVILGFMAGIGQFSRCATAAC